MASHIIILVLFKLLLVQVIVKTQVDANQPVKVVETPILSYSDMRTLA